MSDLSSLYLSCNATDKNKLAREWPDEVLELDESGNSIRISINFQVREFLSLSLSSSLPLYRAATQLEPSV